MWFMSKKMEGKTKEEIDQLYNSESVEFDANHPDTWDDAPADTEDGDTTAQ